MAWRRRGAFVPCPGWPDCRCGDDRQCLRRRPEICLQAGMNDFLSIAGARRPRFRHLLRALICRCAAAGPEVAGGPGVACALPVEPSQSPRRDERFLRLEEDRLAACGHLDVASFKMRRPAPAETELLYPALSAPAGATVEHPEEVLALTFHQQGGDRDARPHPAQPGNGSRRRAAGSGAKRRPSTWRAPCSPTTANATGAARPLAACASPPSMRCAPASPADALPQPFRQPAGRRRDAAAHYATAARRTLLEMVEAEGADADVVAAALAFGQQRRAAGKPARRHARQARPMAAPRLAHRKRRNERRSRSRLCGP